jgi:DnaJ family protein A protein 2
VEKLITVSELKSSPDKTTNILSVMNPDLFGISCFSGWTKKPGQCKAVNDEGMPHYQRPFMKGRLYIQFSVDFPETGSLSPDQCKAIEAILPPRPSSADMTDMELDECEETTLLDVNIEDEMRRKQQQQQEAYEEDEESSGGPRVQCAQQ